MTTSDSGQRKKGTAGNKNSRKTRTGKGDRRKSVREFLPWLLLALSPAAAFLLVECFTHNPFIILTFPVALWNILF